MSTDPVLNVTVARLFSLGMGPSLSCYSIVRSELVNCSALQETHFSNQQSESTQSVSNTGRSATISLLESLTSNLN